MSISIQLDGPTCDRFFVGLFRHISRVGQNCIYTPYMTVYMVNSLPKIPYTHRIYIYIYYIYIYMVLANPTHFTLIEWVEVSMSRRAWVKRHLGACFSVKSKLLTSVWLVFLHTAWRNCFCTLRDVIVLHTAWRSCFCTLRDVVVFAHCVA
jgi:hypothetical protein